jgi:carbohydrate kinase (thermoresistant glucokinase family)
VVILVMGVSGAGKTTIGRALAARLGWVFLDADDDHSAENVQKLRAGIELTDADRIPWLHAVGERVDRHARRGENVVLACSALKAGYRRILEEIVGTMTIVFLTTSREVLEERVSHRPRHFMNAALLDSQIDTLEPPASAITVDADAPVDVIVSRICTALA